MKYLKKLLSGTTIIAAVGICTGLNFAFAEDATATRPNFVTSKVASQEFVKQASASGMTEVELAKMALAKSTHEDVRHFAQMMIEDHTVLNQEVRKFATAKGLPIADEPTLAKQAKAYALKLRDGGSFDEGYAKSQVKSHGETLHLFRQAANSDDGDLKKLADAVIPTLEHHFSMAQTLMDTIATSNATQDTAN